MVSFPPLNYMLKFGGSSCLIGGPRLRSEERRVGKSVDLGGRRIIKKKKKKKKKEEVDDKKRRQTTAKHGVEY